MGAELRFAYADTSFGQVHYAEQGDGPVLLLLHQTPRSWDEFRELIPLLAVDHRVIAMDMVGFGASAKPPAPQTIEVFACGAWELLDALGVGHAAVLGHHTGAAVALEMAAADTERVVALLLSSCPWADERYRTAHASGAGVDRAEQSEDGTHLRTLWDLRRPYYPAPVAGLLDRFVRDALAPGVDPAEGHRACARYRMEDRIGAVTGPVLLIGAGRDPFSMPNLPALTAGLTAARSVRSTVIENGTVALIEREAPAVAAAAREFLTSAEVTWPDVNIVERVR
ncbi:pimeloyl-ACP methyl ester carboxylesterase [Nocardia transvalensis]|uniref:Pimeloyl-ACP methyl ester carboxylesterase n=1 Tax=Nocardia transvalensis TaxID=37333 RepID=A0A7W9PHF7_9NOCA|nr:alpha/beta fold hydrolase [Nocardia transvalensis]MBB5916145.1 pimeloyl-ACP methyl ester carboxylesterase [Nocardia transvalensis]